MNRISAILKQVLLGVLALLLLLPLLQDRFIFVNLTPLSGAITYPRDEVASSAGWFSGSYQKQKELYLNDMFGLRNFFLRLNNQILFSLFHKARVESMVVGKENYLYALGYINAYIGQGCIGVDSAKHLVEKLKFISDKLAESNKQLILVFAAGKGSYYPEFIPDKYQRVGANTDYELLSTDAKQKGLHVLDVNAWFKAKKNSSKYPLYPQYGIHWSKYGSILVADTLVKTIEHLRNIDMPNVYYDSLKMLQPTGNDYDIGDGLNILCKLKSFDMAYATMKVEPDSGKTRPRVLVISDSFYWQMFDAGISKCFKNDHFWYYNKKVFPESFKEDQFVNRLSLRHAIKQHDVIVLMATEPTLQNLGWGFIESANNLYRGRELPHSACYFKKLRDLAAYIKEDAAWLGETIKKAQKEGVSLDKQLIKEAKWVLEEQGVY